MPDPVPLEMPPGDPEAVDELGRDIAGAAFRLAVVRDELAGAAGSAPGWLGDDASAAAAQVVRVAGLAGEAAAAVLTASGRLSAHGELLRETRREVSRLRSEQDEDHRAAYGRLHGLDDIVTAMRTGAPEAVAIVEEFEATEAARRRRHAVLLEELADDSMATARVLADASRPVGGTGRPGDEGRVLAYLAAELPGWGHPELSARGRALADALFRSTARPEDRAALAAEAAAYAGNAVFATALIRSLGEDGVGALLGLLGLEPDGPDNPLAALLAAALGAAVPGDGERDGVAAVLGATYVRADDRYGSSDAAAAGMAAVLSAGTRSASGGPRMATVGEWARQLLLREQVQGLQAGIPPVGTSWRRDAWDAAALAVGIVARGGEPEVASALLGDGRVWEVLLLRAWGDGGIALGELVAEAGRDAGQAGDRAVRVGLETIGAGLFEGDPSDWRVDRDSVAAVAPVLGAAVAAHVHVVTGALTAVASGDIGAGTADRLKGLACLTVDRRAAATVETALVEWSLTQSYDLAGTDPRYPLPVVAVPSAYFAVKNYGQRLAHALDGFERKDDAENKQFWWSITAGLVLELASYVPSKPVSFAADVVGAYGPKLLGMDGTWDEPVDRGLRFDADVAAANALATLPHEHVLLAHAVRAQAAASYDRTAETVGLPEPPDSPPETGAWEPLIEIATDQLGDLAGADHTPGRR